jgi:ornithine carbamoyltransferase
MYQLGGMALFLSANDLQIGRGEPVEDTARVLSRYLDGIMIRTYAQEEVENLAKFGSIPVINGLTDFSHPCQVLADLMTMREYLGKNLTGKKMCFIGDGNNMANSLIVGGLKLGMTVSCACPVNYRPDPIILDFASGYGDKFILTDKPEKAAVNAEVMVTDVWASMGQEKEKSEREIAHKGEEITYEVFEAHATEIFDEAENRLHAQKAVLVKLLG